MKKFVFSMQKVLEYKENLQNSEKAVLKEMRNHYNLLMEEKERLARLYEEKKRELSQKCEEGTQIKEIKIMQSHISGLRDKINDLAEKIRLAEFEIEKQVEKVKKLSGEKTSIEKLKDKYYEQYKIAERKEDEIFINEFIDNNRRVKTENNGITS